MGERRIVRPRIGAETEPTFTAAFQSFSPKPGTDRRLVRGRFLENSHHSAEIVPCLAYSEQLRYDDGIVGGVRLIKLAGCLAGQTRWRQIGLRWTNTWMYCSLRLG